jgi:ribulose-phosphate 3-epimerase
MIEKPERYINTFKEAGANILTVHFEACNHLHRTIDVIKQNGMKAGVAINPHTSPHALTDVLLNLDLVCVMSVNPGFGGQSFIEHTYKKLEVLNQLKKESGNEFLIQIDGGVSIGNSRKLIEKGANVLVAGSSVFKSKDPQKTISDLKDI